jgi:hypothetical protein
MLSRDSAPLASSIARFRNADDGGGDADAMIAVLTNYWSAVRQVFANAWGQQPRHSRLMHGAGIVSLGFLMDAIADRHRHSRIVSKKVFVQDLEPLADECRWTDGYWDFGPGAQRKWNEIQNTTKDIQLLSNHLLLRYKALVWNRAKRDTRSRMSSSDASISSRRRYNGSRH